MSPREQSIRKCATDVLNEIRFAGVPVDPSAVAREKGLHLETQPGFPGGVFGALYFDGAKFGIVVSSECHGDGHRNFTIGHELGHFHIDGHTTSMFNSGAGQVLSHGGHFRDRNTAHEREADWFASELLMPAAWAGPRARGLPASMASIQRLAEDFRVSLCCAAIRFAELADHAVAVVVSRDRQIEWVAFSSRFQDHAWSRRAWKREFVPRHTATDRLARAGERVRRAELDGSSCLLCDWFDGAPETVLAEEEAMGLGSYGRVITVLDAPGLATPDELEEVRQEGEWRERDWRDSIRGYELD